LRFLRIFAAIPFLSLTPVRVSVRPIPKIEPQKGAKSAEDWPPLSFAPSAHFRGYSLPSLTPARISVRSILKIEPQKGAKSAEDWSLLSFAPSAHFRGYSLPSLTPSRLSVWPIPKMEPQKGAKSAEDWSLLSFASSAHFRGHSLSLAHAGSRFGAPDSKNRAAKRRRGLASTFFCAFCAFSRPFPFSRSRRLAFPCGRFQK
jgi:hypothetical protein